MTTPHIARERWRGLDCTRITLPCGDSALVSDFGAQVLSWVVQGQERLFVSTHAHTDGVQPIRGGIPVCFPQFNQRGPLPKHGLARTALWKWHESALPADVTAQWHWCNDSSTLQQWPFAFAATLNVKMAPGQLQVELQVQNTDDQPWAFTAALHTYFGTQDASQCSLAGLDGMAYWDAAHGFAPCVQTGAVQFGAEVDRVYGAPASALQLEGALPGSVHIANDSAWPETVVWNPGPQLCATLADMDKDGWRSMVCVEAASINQPVVLQPGASWRGAQTLRVTT